MLNNRIINTNEPQVVEMLDDAKNFVATLDNVEVIKNCDIIFTLVPTPSLLDGSYDVSAVWQVVEDFKNSGVCFENILTFRDNVKRRFYTLCEASCDA